MLGPNYYRYLKAPTPEQIDQVVNETAINTAQFERYFGIYKKCISHARSGRTLPIKYWHIIFENLPGGDPKLANPIQRRKPIFTPKKRKRLILNPDHKIKAILKMQEGGK
jgi:hypothetical protein